MLKRLLSVVLTVAVPLGATGGQPAQASANKPKYAKTEIEKANATCAIMLLLGLGVSLAGGKKAARVAIPLTVVACVVIQASARHKERVLAAQRTTLNQPGNALRETFQDAKGQNITFSGSGGDDQIIDGALLQPVRYRTIEGQQIAAPVMDTGGKTCRSVSSTLSFDDGRNADLPPQIFCRTPQGDWEPYSVRTA